MTTVAFPTMNNVKVEGVGVAVAVALPLGYFDLLEIEKKLRADVEQVDIVISTLNTNAKDLDWDALFSSNSPMAIST